MSKSERVAYNHIAWNMSPLDNPDFMQSVSERDYVEQLEKEAREEASKKYYQFNNLK